MSRIFGSFRSLSAAGCALAAVACSGGDLVLPEEGDPAAIEMVSGNDQTGPVGTALPAPLVVRVTNGDGEPVEGIRVEWAASAGSVHPEVVVTDADGRASTSRTLGATAGIQTATASSAGLDGSPIRFTHAAVPANDGGGGGGGDGDDDDNGGGGGGGGKGGGRGGGSGGSEGDDDGGGDGGGDNDKDDGDGGGDDGGGGGDDGGGGDGGNDDGGEGDGGDGGDGDGGGDGDDGNDEGKGGGKGKGGDKGKSGGDGD